MPHPPRTILIAGPTAGGKSALAMALAEAVPGGVEIVSADSMQAYRGMDIGTAKPSAADRARVPHHLIDIADPHLHAPTVADWLRDAHAAIEGIHERARTAVLVGGTNLYLRAFIDGLAALPPSDDLLRAELERLPPEELRRELVAADPTAAARIHPNDRRRTVRALEVLRLTGVPISTHQAQWGAVPAALPPGTALVGLQWDTEAINRRINARVGAMMAAGFLREVEALRADGPLLPQPAEAVGYREMLDHLEGRRTLDDAIEGTAIRTRQYAKQQRTWLKRFRAVPGAVWLEGGETVLPGAGQRVVDNFWQ